MMTYTSHVKAYRWHGRVLQVLEQKALPHQTTYIPCQTYRQAGDCIRHMSVRGAPAIGNVAAFGLVLAAQEKKFSTRVALVKHLEKARAFLAKTRPTAVNLFWALDRMQKVWTHTKEVSPQVISRQLETEAKTIHQDDLESCYRMGRYGASLIPKGSVVITHCNTGALATAGHGTALGVIRTAYAQKRIKKVYVDETRPYLQGARLTAWELSKDKIPYDVISDNMAGHLMKTEKIGAVLVGADRIAANGDAANKIGTYALAVLAQYHKVPFYVVAPWTTVDLKTKTGDSIPIEERSAQEVLTLGGQPIAPKKATARHPAFDVTPGRLIRAIVTDRGVVRAPYISSLRKLKNT